MSIPDSWRRGTPKSELFRGRTLVFRAFVAQYRTLWKELTGSEEFAQSERWRINQRVERLNDLDTSIRSTIEFASLVAIETPAHNQTSGHHHDRSGLWWLVVAELSPYCQIYEVSTTQVKKYATGKGTASKMEVMAAAIKRYPQFDIANDNEADAVILAAFLARALGRPIEESLPQANLAALEKFTVSR